MTEKDCTNCANWEPKAEGPFDAHETHGSWYVRYLPDGSLPTKATDKKQAEFGARQFNTLWAKGGEKAPGRDCANWKAKEPEGLFAPFDRGRGLWGIGYLPLNTCVVKVDSEEEAQRGCVWLNNVAARKGWQA